MKLNIQLAQNIVKRTMQIIPHSVNVMDDDGVIIASGDPPRIGQRHSGAVMALRKSQMIEIDEALEKLWCFEVKQGINLPITYLNSNIGVVGISGEPQIVRHYAELVKMAAELMVEQEARLEQERWQSRYKEEFVLSLAKGKLTADEITEQAVFFGLNFANPYVVVMIKLNESNAEQLQILLAHLAHHYPNLATAVVDLQKILIIQPLERLELSVKTSFWQRYLPHDFSLLCKIVIGHPVPNLIEVPFSYHTALHTLQYADHHRSKKQLLFFTDHKAPALLADFAQTWQAKVLFQPLEKLREQDEKQVLFKTLTQYFLSNCDLAHASKKLFIHPNTLRYRMDKIEQITSLSFNKIEGRVILYLGALLLK